MERKSARNTKPKQTRKLGDCYKYAFEAVVGNPGQDSNLEAWLNESSSLPTSKSRDIYLVHGMVTGAVGTVAGKRYGHAWCEVRVGRKWFAVDCGTTRPLFNLFPRQEYYEAGDVSARECRRYNVLEACKIGATTCNYGPWE